MSSAVPLSMPDGLLSKIRDAARVTGLSQADMMRQSMEAGIPVVVSALSFKAGRVTNVDPLPADVAERLYREREDDPAGIRQFIAAQPLHSE